MFPHTFVFIFKYTSLKCINYMRIFIFVIPLMFPPVGHMNMSVEEKSWPVFFHQSEKCLKPLMWKIFSIIKLVCRCMRHKDIESSPEKKPKSQLSYARQHLKFCILIFPGTVAHGTAQPQNPYSVMHIYFVINTDAAFWRISVIFLIMVPVYIEDGNG